MSEPSAPPSELWRRRLQRLRTRSRSGALAAIYAEAAEYPVFDDFVDYSVTGAASNWLASQGIPAIDVELSNRSDTDWKRNLAVIESYRAELETPSISRSIGEKCNDEPVIGPMNLPREMLGARGEAENGREKVEE